MCLTTLSESLFQPPSSLLLGTDEVVISTELFIDNDSFFP